jgi:hypothetical protein
MPKEAGSSGLKKTRRRQERDQTQVRKLTRIFQTIHGLIDAEDDKALAIASGADEGEEREAGEDSRGVGVYVDSNELALRERKGDGSAKVEVGEVGGAKKGILRHHRVQANVDGSEGGNVGRGRTGGGETVTSRGAANAPADVVSERARRAGAEESRRSPLFFNHPVIVGGGRSVRVNGSEGTCALHELDEFVIVSVDPLVPKGTSQRRTKCKGLARRVHVEDGGTR